VIALDITIGRLQKFKDDVLDVFADVTGFGQRRGIDDSEGNAEHPRERLRQQGLAGTGGPDQNDIGFLDFDVGTTAGQFDALVMLIDSDSQLLLGFFLPDHVFIKEGPDLARLGKWRSRRYRLSLLVVGNDLVTDVYTLIADVYGWAGNELLNFILRFTAERAAQSVVSSSYHSPGELR
jgi:hypothetical protein